MGMVISKRIRKERQDLQKTEQFLRGQGVGYGHSSFVTCNADAM